MHTILLIHPRTIEDARTIVKHLRKDKKYYKYINSWYQISTGFRTKRDAENYRKELRKLFDYNTALLIEGVNKYTWPENHRF